MPSAIEVRKVPIHSVSDASELTGYHLASEATAVIARALELARQAPRPVRGGL